MKQEFPELKAERYTLLFIATKLHTFGTGETAQESNVE